MIGDEVSCAWTSAPTQLGRAHPRRTLHHAHGSTPSLETYPHPVRRRRDGHPKQRYLIEQPPASPDSCPDHISRAKSPHHRLDYRMTWM